MWTDLGLLVFSTYYLSRQQFNESQIFPCLVAIKHNLWLNLTFLLKEERRDRASSRANRFGLKVSQIGSKYDKKNYLGFFKISFSTFWLGEPKIRLIWGETDPIWRQARHLWRSYL